MNTTTTKHVGIATLVASGLIATVLGLAAPAAAAPSGTSTVQQTITVLEEQGHRVVVSNPSNTPLDQATVTNVRQGQVRLGPVRDVGHDHFRNGVISDTIIVDVK